MHSQHFVGDETYLEETADQSARTLEESTVCLDHEWYRGDSSSIEGNHGRQALLMTVRG
jgi:hypothetical protein